ncbi:MAG: hypothetical protein M3Z10_10280 [Gemmatimonadota bacterium]|nr:hypothetical protein [Gemmatimonadota bacterium]
MDESFVASVELIAERPSGERTPLALRVGAPTRSPAGDWHCRIHLDGLIAPTDIYGEDSLQALCLGLGMVESLLRRFMAAGGRLRALDASDDETWPIDAYFGGSGAQPASTT